MAVRVLAVSKNHGALKFLERRLDQQIEIVEYCVFAVGNDFYCLVNPDVMLIEIKWSTVYIHDVYRSIQELFHIKPKAKVVAMTTLFNAEIEQEVRDLGVHGYVFLDCHFMNDIEIMAHFSKSILEASKGNKYFTMHNR